MPARFITAADARLFSLVAAHTDSMVGNAKAYAKTARTASVAIPRFRSPAARPNNSSGSLGELPGRRPHQPASVSVIGRTINQSPYEYSYHQFSWFSTN